MGKKSNSIRTHFSLPFSTLIVLPAYVACTCVRTQIQVVTMFSHKNYGPGP